jgi:nitrite reductase/ring-hydroxylating ferredoxin subunit
MPLFGRGPAAKDEFVTVARSDAVGEEGVATVKIGGRKVILLRHAGQVYAVDSLCPHAAADLTQGSRRNWQICCHEHNYCFDVRNGRIVWPEDEVYRLRRYAVKEEDGAILVNIAAPPM